MVTREYFTSTSAHSPKDHFHSGIPEERLIQLYREADAVLIPVCDATANNAALEELACCKPVISTMVGGMPDYVDNTCGCLFKKGEVARIVKLIGEICKAPEMASSRRAPEQRARFQLETRGNKNARPVRGGGVSSLFRICGRRMAIESGQWRQAEI